MPLFSATVGYKGYCHYLVYEGNNPIAGGALFVRNQYASMAIAGTLPEHRSKGAQGELLRERILQARAEGCRWVTVETSRETAEKKVASFRNMKRFGFNITYHRPNFIYYP
jgi:GNAT superfamily N-acetyltransferase